jgi:6-phosphofructokinase 2
MNHDVLTITLNPAVDKNYTVENLVPDNKLRCRNPRIDAGGGGINVSKGILRLGGHSLALTLTGGRNGELLRDLISNEGIDLLEIPISEETRESIVISEASTRHQYRIVVDGPQIEAKVADEILEKIRQMYPRPSIIVASGSLPVGISEDYYARIGKLAKEKGAKYIVDSSGKSLQYAVEEGVYLVKPNLKELSALSGIDSLELDDVDEAAMELIKRGKCEVVMVSLGAAGAMLVTAGRYKHIPSPTVDRKSTVGDSMVAGMVWAIRDGRSLEEMAMMGVACGTAATMNPGTQLFTKEDAMKLYKWIAR